MINPKYEDRIARDPKSCGDEPTIRGTRVTLRSILASLAEGDRPEEIVEAFPSLCLDDIRAAIAFAIENAGDELPERIVLLSAR